ncbi:Alpha/Beta hydrolase protein [Hygrophoropsis aurantiaca]|uniref:Alpha/Beta hydrolase protein n=1 Tax=Hygrophoropsis aurantiaca TaxID=72124 RepID=A0ACB8A0R3_9AGAM|nr:Alpha/Beta hydrolase protein [Hygrophoropsis aurantiaca]
MSTREPDPSSCFRTVQHSGTPVGERISIKISVDSTEVAVPTYLSRPPGSTSATATRNVLLYFSDVFGPFYINSQLMQDYFAGQGLTVVGIDYFDGDPVGPHLAEPGFDRAVWRDKSVARAVQWAPRWVESVRAMFGSEDVSYHAVGYCFGAPYALDLAGTGWLASAAVAHPTNLQESHFQEAKAPLFFGCAETDHAFPASARRRAEDILVERHANYYFQTFSGVSHGFATRGDPGVGSERWAKEECARGMAGWFGRFGG